MASILVVEDDVITNESISEYLRDSGHSVLSALDGHRARSLFTAENIDVVILDIMLPKVNGFTLLREFHQSGNALIMMLTALNDEDTQIACFDGMADDYLTKPFSMALLGRRITALLRRSGKCDPAAFWCYDNVRVDFTGFYAEKDGTAIDVSPKEIVLLKLLVENQGIVLTREQILDRIWGQDMPLNDRTIDTYIGRLRKKLGLDCIVTIKGIGYKFEVRR